MGAKTGQMHGRDHRAGGSDPIPGIGTGGELAFVTYPQSGVWLHIETTSVDPNVDVSLAAGTTFGATASADDDARTMSLRATAPGDGDANALRTHTEAAGDGDATGVYSTAETLGDGGATAFRGAATTDGAEDADGVYAAAEATGAGDAHGGSFYGVTQDPAGDATGVVADATAAGGGNATGLRVTAGSTDAGGSGDAIGGHFWAVAAGSGAAKPLVCLDEAGTPILEVWGDGTFHIKTGAAWVDDL